MDCRYLAETRVMSDPVSMITSTGAFSREPICAKVEVALEPRKEVPAGRAISLGSGSGESESM